MKLNAVGVVSKDMKKSIEFYTLLGFEFPSFTENEDHIESKPQNGSAKLMIDTFDLIKNIIGKNPVPGNHSSFALEYNSPTEIDQVVGRIKIAGFTVVNNPWDAFWGQRYAIVEDPDGYKVDLYAPL